MRLVLAIALAAGMALSSLGSAQTEPPMQTMITRFSADEETLRHRFDMPYAPHDRARFRAYYEGELADLQKQPFDSFDQDGKIDYLLLKNALEARLRAADLEDKRLSQLQSLISFGDQIYSLEEARRRVEPIKYEELAGSLSALAKQIKSLQESLGDGSHVDKVQGLRAEKIVRSLERIFAHWYGFYDKYDPLFTWWVPEPYKAASKALSDYAMFLSERVVGIKEGDASTIVGDPIGRDGLVSDLQGAMIDYTPEELISLAEKEYAWCEGEMKKASREMGFGDDWKKALEKVKTLHVAPGEQPAMIKGFADEAIAYMKKHDLVTVPPLAEETWTMEMMSPERQLVNPFFLGGDTILVSFPTDGMTQEQKEMSMRGNNPHFARATVFHELIPGHRLQDYYLSRYHPYRTAFYTPFWIEGWALYWEMFLWDKGYARGPEDKVGMLFWRMHRCARIIFSLKFHMGQMTPEQCVDFLVDKVGHERANAEGEVRRSFNGDYEPLYQAAYMIGGLQIRALHHDLVDSGKMTDRAFHDAIMEGNTMPIELVRASLTHEKLTRDHKSTWRFYPL